MKFPLSWFKQILETKLSAKEIAHKLTSIGLEVDGVEELKDETLFDVAITPNLGHTASVFGMARELAALTQDKVALKAYPFKESTEAKIETLTSVTIDEPKLCPRYAARVILGVKVGPSPDWLKARVEACGLRSVNNVVDATNHALLEYGHPLHAFDFDTLAGKKIVVRKAKEKEKITTLDGQTLYPTPQTLLICDEEGPIAIAGVMGSLATEVTEKTQNIFLEAAYFKPTQVRRTSKRMHLHTDASRRFERGSDPNSVREALDRAAGLIQQVAGGEGARGVIDIVSETFAKKEISLRQERVNTLLGTEISLTEIETLLKRLGFEISATQENRLSVLAPTYRVDVLHEIDLVEEVARLYGFDNLFQTKQMTYSEGELLHSPMYLFEQKTRTACLSQGLQELLSSSLISESEANLMAKDFLPKRAFVHLLNPSNAAQSVLRPSLLPSLLHVAKHNLSHESHTLWGFEVGKTHFKVKDVIEEHTVVSILLMGKRSLPHFDPKPPETDFFDLKGIVENLFGALHIADLTFSPSEHANFHPKQQAQIESNGLLVGMLGQIHPNTLAECGIETPIFFAELNIQDLLHLPKKSKNYQSVSRQPASGRDVTLTIRANCPVQTLFSLIESQEETLLETVSLLDVYQSEKLGSEWRNITFRFVYRDPVKTLSFEIVEKRHEALVAKLVEKLRQDDRLKQG